MLHIALMLASSIFAAEPAVIALWPDPGVPDMEKSVIGPNDTERRLSVVSRPTLTVYPATNPTGTAVIVAPGGGFRHLAIDKEGHDAAKWLTTLGITAFVLKYRAGSDPDSKVVRERSIQDTRQAMKIVRSRAMEWKVKPDRIGFLGFSAGGMLAAEIGMNYDPETKPAFVAPIYSGPMTGFSVPADAPPAFFAAAHDDALTLNGTIPLYVGWAKAKRPAVLHIFAKGGHGFGIRKTGAPADAWTDRLAEWLKLQGF